MTRTTKQAMAVIASQTFKPDAYYSALEQLNKLNGECSIEETSNIATATCRKLNSRW